MRIGAVLLAACGGAGGGKAPDDSGGASSVVHPLDDTLTFGHLQARGTHNSYHVQTADRPEWRYTHAPLDEQLGGQGVRQFELDIYWDSLLGEHVVVHIPLIDAGVTCGTVAECAGVMEQWSRANPGHHPIVTLLETRTALTPTSLDDLEAELLSVWPAERLITPAEVRGTHASLRDAVETDGWPTLGQLRGRALFVLHDAGEWRDALVERLDDTVLFPDGKGTLDEPWSAFQSMNDPFDPGIPEAVGRGHLVRTRADADVGSGEDDNRARLAAARASGAHFLSSDFPAADQAAPDGYWLDLPGGTPSLCNPVTAPEACTAEAVEDPARIR